MNTIFHLAALLASLWASIFAFETLKQPELGGAFLILFFGYIALTAAAIDDDVFLVHRGFKIFRFRGDQREEFSFSSKIALAVTAFFLIIAVIDNTDFAGNFTTDSDVNVLNSQTIGAPITAFGEVSTAEMTPIVQLQFPYAVNPRLVTSLTAGSGAATVSGSLLTVATGTTTASDVLFRSVLDAKYHPGQGALDRFTAVFDTTGTSGTKAVIGIGNEEDGYFFGYDGPAFGVLHRFGGKVEHQTLTITAGAGTATGTITITLDDKANMAEVELGRP